MSDDCDISHTSMLLTPPLHRQNYGPIGLPYTLPPQSHSRDVTKWSAWRHSIKHQVDHASTRGAARGGRLRGSMTSQSDARRDPDSRVWRHRFPASAVPSLKLMTSLRCIFAHALFSSLRCWRVMMT